MAPEPPAPGPPVIEEFSVSAVNGILTHGSWTTLRWRAPGATRIFIDPVPPKAPDPADDGAVAIRPFETVTYRITVANDHGSDMDSVTVQVIYRAGIYVDPASGDDTRSGSEPQQALATLAEALARTPSALFLAAGDYPTALAINGTQVNVYGGLDPSTFFEGGPGFQSRIRPTSGIPLSVRNVFGPMEIQDVSLDARFTDAVCMEVVDAEVRISRCLLDARLSTTAPPTGAAALRVVSEGGVADVQARACRIFGTRSGPTETRAVSVEQSAGTAHVRLANCFLFSGIGTARATGVHVDTGGDVEIGMCTIGAQITGFGDATDNAAAVRIVRGEPAIGGNILFTRGAGMRFGVQETTDLANPLSLEGNLFISVGTTPYDNFQGQDPSSEQDLRDFNFTIAPNQVVGENRLEEVLSVSQIVVDLDTQDYHLTLPGPGTANPAVNRGETWVAKPAYGAVDDDIDGDGRPSRAHLWDLGADEME